MIRQAAAVVVVLLLSPSWVTAQGTELSINVASASVHKSPSTASPVIGHVGRGARLEVTRNVGDWVKVAWPAAPDGVGYVRSAFGSMTQATGSKAPLPNTASATRTGVQPTPRLVTSSAVEPPQTQTGNRLPVRSTTPSSGPSHVFGLGARLGGPSFGVGASARGWTKGKLGMQFEISRYEISDPITLGTMSSTQFGPSLLYAFNDRVADYTWLRPYVGTGLNIFRSSMIDPFTAINTSESTLGYQVFGGGELSFASLPQLAVSAELGYHWSSAPFPGFEISGTAFSIAGHWYIK
jgi:hypothetical protein